MKYLTIFLMVLFIGCTDKNPMGIEDAVTVYLSLTQNGSATKISCEGVLVSYLQYKGERDTIKVPDESELKARIYDGGSFIYQTKKAKDGLNWILP